MAKFESVKRATIGNLVKGDASGFDEWIVGKITAVDSKKGTISFAPADGTEEITMVRSEVYKATTLEYAEQDVNAKQPKLNTRPDLNNVLNTMADVALGRNTGKDNEKPVVASENPEAILAAETDPEAEEDTKEEPLARISTYAKNYETVLASSGKKSKDSGDRVAVELRGLALSDVYAAVALALDVDTTSLIIKYKHLNDGQQRMCLGNRLRGLYKRQDAEIEAAEIEAAMKK